MENYNIREIALALNCSASTVSRVLSGRQSGTVRIGEKTRAKILEYCERHNYIPSIHAGRLFSKRARVIGFLNDGGLSGDQNLALSLFTVCDELFQAGYRCLPLLNNADFIRNREYLKIFERQEVDALIVWGANTRYRYLEELEKAQMPFLLLTNRYENYPAVFADQHSPVAEMVRQCRAQGASRFSFFFADSGDSFRQREEGFLENAGEHYMRHIAPQTFEDAYRVAPQIWAAHPDAIICGNDCAAVGVEAWLLEHGVEIPRDVLLTGGDNLPVSRYCTVPITTFDQRAADCAALCVKKLLECLEHGEKLVSECLTTRAIFRASTGDGGNIA